MVGRCGRESQTQGVLKGRRGVAERRLRNPDQPRVVFGSRFRCRDPSSAIAGSVDDLGTPDRDQAAICTIKRHFQKALARSIAR